eukprot:2421163-Prymnesium_polylepis.1
MPRASSNRQRSKRLTSRVALRDAGEPAAMHALQWHPATHRPRHERRARREQAGHRRQPPAALNASRITELSALQATYESEGGGDGGSCIGHGSDAAHCVRAATAFRNRPARRVEPAVGDLCVRALNLKACAASRPEERKRANRCPSDSKAPAPKSE